MSCSYIKKIEEEPEVKQSDVKPHLESFIQKNMKNGQGIHVVKISKNKSDFNVLTTGKYCERIKGQHDGDVTMSYIISKGLISQKCPICRDGKNKPKSVVHRLSASVINALKPSK